MAGFPAYRASPACLVCRASLACLAFRDVFKAGASHFGVADLERLALDTHKFESRYLDSLVGPYPERRDLYMERSPIHHIEGLNSPTVFFHRLRAILNSPRWSQLSPSLAQQLREICDNRLRSPETRAS